MLRYLAAVLLSVPLASPGGATEIAAEFNLDVAMSSFASFGAAGPVSARGQSFTAEVSGRVESVGLRVSRTSDHALKLRISILRVGEDGKPTGSPILVGDFPGSLIPVDSDGEAVIFPFENGPMLEAGVRYALTFRPTAYLQTETPFYINGAVNADASYEGGMAMRSADNGDTWTLVQVIDFGFRVTVAETVPVDLVSWGSLKRVATR
jgi:hypothetical protein